MEELVILQKTYNYEVSEDYIDIDTSGTGLEPDLSWFFFNTKTFLNRKTLDLGMYAFGTNLDVSVRAICKIVDYDPLEKFEKKIKEIEVTKKKKKKI